MALALPLPRRVRERFQRIEEIRLPADEVAARIGTSEEELARWITGSLPVEESDIIEVGLTMLEMRRARRSSGDAPTQPLAALR